MKLFFLLVLLVSACARINTAERDQYAEMKRMRHGIVPREDAPKTKIAQKIDEARAARGRFLYKQECLKCHGESGKGDGELAKYSNPKPANLRTTVSEVHDFDFYLSVSEWAGSMPGWRRRYTSDELDDLKAYLKTFRD